METLTSLPTSSTAPSSTGAEAADMGKEHMYSCSAEEVADAKLTTRRETLLVIESLTQEFLRAIANGDDPELHLVNIYMYYTSVCVLTCVYMYMQATRSERNVLRDSQGHLHLGRSKSVKKLFSKNAIGTERYAKSE